MEILNHARNPHARRSPALLTMLMVLAVAASAQPVEEYQVKAAFLYNFAKFIQWPATSFPNSNTPFSFCILGEDPFGRSLEENVTGAIDGRPLVIRRISALKQVAGCQVLFVSSADNKRALSLLAEIDAPGILTVGDSNASGAAGVVINFKLESGKVRFDINTDAAERAKLHISSRLLNLGHVVEHNRK